MDYAVAAELSRILGLGIFFTFFLAVLVWIYRPGVRAKFDAHARIPLEDGGEERSEEHTSELQSLMRISYAVFCLKKKNTKQQQKHTVNEDLQQLNSYNYKFNQHYVQ